MVAEKHRKESISDNWKELGRISLIVLSELSLCVLARLLLKKNPGGRLVGFLLSINLLANLLNLLGLTL